MYINFQTEKKTKQNTTENVYMQTGFKPFSKRCYLLDHTFCYDPAVQLYRGQ